MRYVILAGLLFAALSPLVTTATESGAKSDRPNVLFIFTDDQRFDTVGALGNPDIHTPYLDRLTETGFIFRNAYCFGGNGGAVCIFSRNMAMSGRNFFRFHDAQGRNSNYAEPELPTFPKSMSAAGYETYYAEKSGAANLRDIRLQFDYHTDIHMVNNLRTGYAARTTIDGAIEYLDETRDDSKPFFMYLGLPCPHDPRWSAQEFRDMYDQSALPLPPNYLPLHPFNNGEMTIRDESLEVWPRTEDAIRRHLFDYYSLITCMDADIGRLLDRLDQLELTEDTIIVFSSDQGLAMGSHGLMGKQNIYEDTMKVPLIFSGPGIPKGETDAMTYIHDIYPTICDMVGADMPEGVDGLSLQGVVEGETKSVRDTIFLAYRDFQRSVRDERWKLIRYPQINRTQLFDLAADPRETNDLAGDPTYAPQIERLMELLAEEQKLHGDELPLTSDNPSSGQFDAPAPKRTAYPAGGLAPGSP
jgi:arylsulfatase A-like enzyme